MQTQPQPHEERRWSIDEKLTRAIAAAAAWQRGGGRGGVCIRDSEQGRCLFETRVWTVSPCAHIPERTGPASLALPHTALQTHAYSLQHTVNKHTGTHIHETEKHTWRHTGHGRDTGRHGESSVQSGFGRDLQMTRTRELRCIHEASNYFKERSLSFNT